MRSRESLFLKAKAEGNRPVILLSRHLAELRKLRLTAP